jgi:hypothetical protein
MSKSSDYIKFLFNMTENNNPNRLSNKYELYCLNSRNLNSKFNLHKHKSSAYFLSFPYSWCHVLKIVRFQLLQSILLCCHIAIPSFDLYTRGCIFIPGSPLFYICLNKVDQHCQPPRCNLY